MVWALVIAVSLHLFAYLIYKMGESALEEEHLFLGVRGAYLVIFFLAVIGMKFLIPNPGSADVSLIPQAFISSVSAAE